MNEKWIHALCVIALLAATGLAQATITCNISSPGFTAAYVPSNPGDNVTQTNFSVTCTRGAGGDGTTVNYSVTANNGVHASGTQNRAASGASLISYDVYKVSGCGSQWRGGANGFTGLSMTLVGFVPTTQQTTYWGCITAGQTGLPAGTYTDTVTMTVAGTAAATNTFPVTIYTPASCSVSTAPGTITFNYVAFGGAIAPTTNFAINCTSQLPYTMALDAVSGTAFGLNYTLALSAAGGTGSGIAQSNTVNGAMVAGQAGTCATGSCSSTTARTLTISY